MKKTLAVLMLPLLLLVMTSCDNELKDVAERMTEVADSIGAVQDVVIDAYDKGLISKDIQDNILTGTLKASQVGNQITDVLTELEKEGVSELDLDSKRKILRYLTIITEAIDPNAISEIANITDESVQLKIRTGLEAARSLIATIELMLAVGG